MLSSAKSITRKQKSLTSDSLFPYTRIQFEQLRLVCANRLQLWASCSSTEQPPFSPRTCRRGMHQSLTILVALHRVLFISSHQRLQLAVLAPQRGSKLQLSSVANLGVCALCATAQMCTNVVIWALETEGCIWQLLPGVPGRRAATISAFTPLVCSGPSLCPERTILAVGSYNSSAP